MTYRRLFPLLFAFLLTAPFATAQPADSLIAQGKRLLDSGHDRGDIGAIRQARALFLRAADGDLQPGLAAYYAGLTGYRLLPLLEKDEEHQMKVLNDAIVHLEATTEQAPQMADAHALLSGLYGWKAGKQWHKAMFLGPKADRAMERAQQLAPNNPRVVLLNAIGLFQKPGMFGGDKKKALNGFERAARLAAQETVTDPLAPDWGHAEAHAWMGVAHLNADRPAQAHAAFQEALRANPDYGWVKDVLMPQLAEARK